MNDDNERSMEKNVVCPWCDYVFKDSWEFGYKTFDLNVSTLVYYNTKRA